MQSRGRRFWKSRGVAIKIADEIGLCLHLIIGLREILPNGNGYKCEQDGVNDADRRKGKSRHVIVGAAHPMRQNRMGRQ